MSKTIGIRKIEETRDGAKANQQNISMNYEFMAIGIGMSEL